MQISVLQGKKIITCTFKIQAGFLTYEVPYGILLNRGTQFSLLNFCFVTFAKAVLSKRYFELFSYSLQKLIKYHMKQSLNPSKTLLISPLLRKKRLRAV